MGFLDGIGTEFKTRNFSIYGQWTGILSIILCLALGIANIFTFNAVIIIFSVICLLTGLIIIFLEIPLLLRICPTSATFDGFVRKLHSVYGRAGFYLVAGVVQWLSLIVKVTALMVPAIFLTLAGLFYLIAGLKKQEFTGSKTLGGAGIAQMIV